MKQDVSSVSCLDIGHWISETEIPTVSHVWAPDQGAQGMDRRVGRAPALLVEAPRDHARSPGRTRPVSSSNGRGPWPEELPHDPATCPECHWVPPDLGPEADLGDIVVILLVSTLAGLRDRLHHDGFDGAAGLVDDLVEMADDYVLRLPR